MEAHVQHMGCTLPDAGPLGAIGGQQTRGTVLVRTRRIPVRELRGLPSLWPRDELDAAQVRAIRRDLQAGGEILIPVVVRCEPGHEAVVVDLVAGDHRIEAAFREGRSELPVQVLACTPSEALLWLLRESANPGTSRQELRRAWAIEQWIKESGFKGTQRDLSVMLGITESTMSELRKFAKSLPEALVKERAAGAGIPVSDIVQLQRSALRKLKKCTPGEALDILDRALLNMTKGMTADAAWEDVLRGPADIEAARSTPWSLFRQAITYCHLGTVVVRGRLATATEKLARAVVVFLLGILKSLRRPLLAAKRRLDARAVPEVAPELPGDREKASTETSAGEMPRTTAPDQTSPESPRPPEGQRNTSPGEVSGPLRDEADRQSAPSRGSAKGSAPAEKRPRKSPDRRRPSSSTGIIPAGAFKPG